MRECGLSIRSIRPRPWIRLFTSDVTPTIPRADATCRLIPSAIWNVMNIALGSMAGHVSAVDPEILLRLRPGPQMAQLFSGLDACPRRDDENLRPPATPAGEESGVDFEHADAFGEKDRVTMSPDDGAHRLGARLVDPVEARVFKEPGDPVRDRRGAFVGPVTEFLRQRAIGDRHAARVLPFGPSQAFAKRGAPSLIGVGLTFSRPFLPGEGHRGAQQGKEIPDVDSRFVVELDFRLSRPFRIGRYQRHARGYGLGQELDPFDDTPLPVVQGGVASMAADRRIDEVATRPIRAFSDAGALPANHIGRESVGQTALERGKPQPAVFDLALQIRRLLSGLIPRCRTGRSGRVALRAGNSSARGRGQAGARPGGSSRRRRG